MENLNKENFFDLMTEKYPRAMQHFHEWIDAYKVAVNWNTIFNSDSNWQDSNGKNAPAPKFHDLPYEFQFGILYKFIAESLDEEDREEQQLHVGEMKELLDTCFAELQVKLKPSATDLQEKDIQNIAEHGESNNDI